MSLALDDHPTHARRDGRQHAKRGSPLPDDEHAAGPVRSALPRPAERRVLVSPLTAANTDQPPLVVVAAQAERPALQCGAMPTDLAAFVAKWSAAGPAERAN